MAHIRYDLLLQMISWGVPSKVPKAPGPIDGSFNGGKYLGAPGKDIYQFLPELTDKQMDEVADCLAESWKTKTGAHVGPAACIRYIYGQYDKQGTLLSPEALKDMKKNPPDWTLARKFITILRQKFIEKDKPYGVCIICEMEGHRLGDEALLDHNNPDKLNEMEKVYLESVKYAHICGSMKQTFTPYYWAAMYFIQAGDNERASRYTGLTMEEAEKYCPDSRESYVDKIAHCIEYITQHQEPIPMRRWIRRWRTRAENPVIKKALKRFA